MKCQFFPLVMIFATVSFGAVLLFVPASASLVADNDLYTAEIESITGMKGLLKQKQNTFKVSKPRADVAISWSMVQTR